MEKHDKDFLQTFDALYTTNQIQIMKILLPYCNPDSRRGLAVMIKFMEFDYTLRLTRTHPESFQEEALPFSLSDICDKVKNYCSPQVRSMLEQFQSIQNAMQMYEEMKQYMDLFQGMSTNDADGAAGAAEGNDSAPESGKDGEKAGNSPFSAGGMNPMDMIMGMLSPDQQSMFQMFQSDFNTEAASTGNTDMGDSPPERDQ